MLALASEGRQVEALRAYQRYRRFLGEELGTSPSAWVTTIEQRISSAQHFDIAPLLERGGDRRA